MPVAASPELLACPTCDMLHTVAPSRRAAGCAAGAAATVLLTNRRGAIDRTLASSFASVILMVAAIFFPFLELSVAGLHKNASLLDAALAFSHGLMAPLSVATTLLIIVLPVVRASALAYTLLPLRLGRPPAAGAARAFRLAEHLSPGRCPRSSSSASWWRW